MAKVKRPSVAHRKCGKTRPQQRVRVDWYLLVLSVVSFVNGKFVSSDWPGQGEMTKERRPKEQLKSINQVNSRKATTERPIGLNFTCRP